MQATLAVTLYPLSKSLNDLSPSPLLKPDILQELVFEPEFISQLTLAACGFKVEEGELGSLTESLRAAVCEGVACLKENQAKALDVLCWIASVHCNSSDR